MLDDDADGHRGRRVAPSHSPAYAFCGAAMPDLVIASIASAARFTFSGYGSLIMSMNTAGTTCLDSPYLAPQPATGHVLPPSDRLLQ